MENSLTFFATLSSTAIDFEALREHKCDLLRVIDATKDQKKKDSLDAILGLLDYVQDQFAEASHPEVVFGKLVEVGDTVFTVDAPPFVNGSRFTITHIDDRRKNFEGTAQGVKAILGAHEFRVE